MGEGAKAFAYPATADVPLASDAGLPPARVTMTSLCGCSEERWDGICYPDAAGGTSGAAHVSAGSGGPMDNSLSLARYFARLVWLLAHEGEAVSDQKAALRAVVTVSRDASARLRNEEGRLAVNGLVMPQALTGVQELAERLSSDAIEEIAIDQSASAAELLALARLLATESTTTSDAAEFARKLSELQGETVRVKRAVASAPVPAEAGDAAVAARGPRDAAESRVPKLLAKLARERDPAEAHRLLDDIGHLAEQATREGRTPDAAAIFSALLDAEAALTEPEVRRLFLATVRRLTKPTILRPITSLVVTQPAMASLAEQVLQRVGVDGVDSVVDQYAGARSVAERNVYHEVLSRLASARESLTQMLTDPRWYVVRRAAELLGEMGGEEAERPLAELLRHGDERVRRAATRALARVESAFTLDALARAAADPSPSVRLEAVAALASRKGARAGSMLAKAIDDETEQEVQYAILAALGRVATSEAVQKLSKAAEAASGLFAARKNSGLRVAAVFALGDAHTAGALATLQSLVHDKDRDVREAVARTLQLERGTAA